MNPPTDREKALAEALEKIAANDPEANRQTADAIAIAALTAPTPTAPTDGPSDSQMLEWLLAGNGVWVKGVGVREYFDALHYHPSREHIRSAMQRKATP